MNSLIDYNCYVISNKFHLFSDIEKSIFPETVNYFDGENKGCFSKLVNLCVEQCPTETVIMMSDKVRPKSSDIKKVLNLLNEGYGFVALYRFAFFGFKKDLFRKIGPMDERFIGGGYEDDDFYIRLKEANIAMYVTEEVEYLRSFSSWNYSLSRPHFLEKWIPHYNPAQPKEKKYRVKRNLQEEKYNYNYGVGQHCNYREWKDTYAPAVTRYVNRDFL